jgi:AraC-like DNA-binding protein
MCILILIKFYHPTSTSNKEEKTTFRRILGKVKQEIAMDYLKDVRISICEIALLLGFSDQSAFNRAFKRWTGMAPRQYRSK